MSPAHRQTTLSSTVLGLAALSAHLGVSTSHLVTAQDAPVEQLRCLPPSDLSYIGSQKSLTLEQNDWLGHAVTTQTAALLLREVLGFDVKVEEIPMAWGDASNDPLSRLSEGTVDANLEGWEIDWPTQLMSDYVEKKGSVETSIHDFQGRVGAYLPRYVVDDNPSKFPDYWRAFTQPEVLDLFRWNGAQEATDLATLREEWADNCDADSYGCDGGEWKLPRCAEDENSADGGCIPFFHVYPEYAVGWVEQLVTNLNLNISVYYAGWDLYDLIRQLKAQRKPLLFYSWRPHELLARNEYVRITFPERNHVCESLDTDDRFGGRDCDHEGLPVYKLTNKGLASRSRAAHEFIHKRYSLRLEDQYSLLAELEAGGHGGNLTTEEAACQWAKDNEDRWTPWVQAVSAAPPPCSEISEDQINQFPVSEQEGIRQKCFAEQSTWLTAYAAPVLGAIAGVILLTAIVFVTRRQYKKYVKALTAEAKALKERKERVKHSIEATFEMQYSFCIVRLDQFKNTRGLQKHERARQLGRLTILDTWEDSVEFAHKNPVVFLSHQWLSMREPDPDHVQYDAIIVAAEALCKREGIKEEELYLWCDYHSIPQANRVMQKASIATISVYAACCKYFIAVVPPTTQVDSGNVADGTSYSHRGWCRVEQVAYILIHGPDQAHYCDNKKLNALSSDWVHDAICVYEGQFSNDDDKYLLVDVVLGLFGLAVLTGDDAGEDSYGSLINRIIENKDRVFPTEFFGDLISLLESEIAEARSKFRNSTSIDVFGDEQEPIKSTRAKGGTKISFGMHGMYGVAKRSAGIDESTDPHISEDDYERMIRARKAFSKITGRKLKGKEFRQLSNSMLTIDDGDDDEPSVATTDMHG